MRDITLEDTFYHQFTTRAFATGIPTVLAGTPVLSVLEENNATPITAGVSVSVDRASVVGLNEATIVATAANGYDSGKSYAIYISTGTVGGVSVVGEVVGQFTIAASAAAVDLANGTDGLGAIKTDTAAVKTKTDFLPSATAGAAGGVLIAGVNAPVTISGAGTALTIQSTGSNGNGLFVQGQGSGSGLYADGGSTGHGIYGEGGSTSGNAVNLLGGPSSSAFLAQGVHAGSGIEVTGGSTGHGISANGGTNGDGIVATLGGTGVDIRGDITGDLTGTVATLTTYTGNTLQTADVNTLITTVGTAGVGLTDLGGMSTAMKAEVNAEVDTALNTTTYAEPGQELPASTTTIQNKIGYLYKAWRNRSNQTATTYQLFNDDATTVDQKATVSDDATTAEKGEVATGP